MLPKGQEEDSVFAREGTIAHSLGEIEAGRHFGLITEKQYTSKLRLWKKEFDAQGYEKGTLEEMQGHIFDYIDFIEKRLAEHPHSSVMLEKRMDTGVPRSWGTSDTVIVSPVHVEIIDLKYGAGVPVAAKKNTQLRLYGCGALDTFGDLLGETLTVTMSVFQPRVDNYDSETLTADELRAWRDDVAIPGALETENPDAKFGPSPGACRWCPVAGICTARVEYAVAEDFGDPFVDEPIEPKQKPELMTPEMISQILPKLATIRSWCEAVEASALETAFTRGEKIPGFKVVMSGGKRGITDPAAVITTMIDLGYNAEDVSDIKTKGLGVLEKLLGGRKKFDEHLGKYVAKSAGRESLVPEDDKRAEISPTAQAAADFS